MMDLKLLASWTDFELVERTFMVDFTCIYHASNKNLRNVWPNKLSGEVLELIVDWEFFTGKEDVLDDWLVSSTWTMDNGVDVFATEWDDKTATIFVHGGADRAVYEVKNIVLFDSGRREERVIKYIVDNQTSARDELNVIHVY